MTTIYNRSRQRLHMQPEAPAESRWVSGGVFTLCAVLGLGGLYALLQTDDLVAEERAAHVAEMYTARLVASEQGRNSALDDLGPIVLQAYQAGLKDGTERTVMLSCPGATR